MILGTIYGLLQYGYACQGRGPHESREQSYCILMAEKTQTAYIGTPYEYLVALHEDSKRWP